MSEDKPITAYVEIKGETPPDTLSVRDVDFYKAVKPSAMRVAGVKRKLLELGFTMVDPKTGDYNCWDNRIIVRGSKGRFDEVFGLDVVQNNDHSKDASTHFSHATLNIKDESLADNVTNVIFATKAEIEPDVSSRRVARTTRGGF